MDRSNVADLAADMDRKPGTWIIAFSDTNKAASASWHLGTTPSYVGCEVHSSAVQGHERWTSPHGTTTSARRSGPSSRTTTNTVHATLTGSTRCNKSRPAPGIISQRGTSDPIAWLLHMLDQFTADIFHADPEHRSRRSRSSLHFVAGTSRPPNQRGPQLGQALILPEGQRLGSPHGWAAKCPLDLPKGRRAVVGNRHWIRKIPVNVPLKDLHSKFYYTKYRPWVLSLVGPSAEGIGRRRGTSQRLGHNFWHRGLLASQHRPTSSTSWSGRSSPQRIASWRTSSWRSSTSRRPLWTTPHGSSQGCGGQESTYNISSRNAWKSEGERLSASCSAARCFESWLDPDW